MPGSGSHVSKAKSATGPMGSRVPQSCLLLLKNSIPLTLCLLYTHTVASILWFKVCLVYFVMRIDNVDELIIQSGVVILVVNFIMPSEMTETDHILVFSTDILRKQVFDYNLVKMMMSK